MRTVNRAVTTCSSNVKEICAKQAFVTHEESAQTEDNGWYIPCVLIRMWNVFFIRFSFAKTRMLNICLTYVKHMLHMLLWYVFQTSFYAYFFFIEYDYRQLIYINRIITMSCFLTLPKNVLKTLVQYRWWHSDKHFKKDITSLKILRGL